MTESLKLIKTTFPEKQTALSITKKRSEIKLIFNKSRLP